MPLLIPNAKQKFTNANNLPLAGGKVYTYAPGTSTLVDTYSDRALSNVNENPISLNDDGSPTSAMWGDGIFRQVVFDQNNTQIWDAEVSTGPKDIDVSDAMLDVLSASSHNAALNLLGDAGNFHIQEGSLTVDNDLTVGGAGSMMSLSIEDGDQSITSQPTANPTIDTQDSVNVQGSTKYDNAREFLVSMGFTSDKGKGGSNTPDKVTLYVGGLAKKGSADFWTVNTCLTMDDGFDGIAQGIELDFNNNSEDRGNSGNISTDLSSKTAYGLSITGASQFSSTGGLCVTGNNVNDGKCQWNRGIVVAGRLGVCAFQDASFVPVAMQFDGIYADGAINMTARYGNAGASGVNGAEAMAALFMKYSHQIVWQNPTKAHLIYDGVTSASERIIGGDDTGGSTCQGILMGNKTYPLYAGVQLGIVGKEWGDLHAAALYPSSTDSFSIGSSDLEYTDVFSQNSGTVSSDVAMKTDVQPLPSVKELVNAITPIRFKWKQTDGGRAGRRTHWGFNAAEVGAAFDAAGHDFAGYVKKPNGKHAMRPEQMVPVLWQAVKDLMDEVAELKAKKGGD